jgi:hypothetical protein
MDCNVSKKNDKKDQSSSFEVEKKRCVPEKENDDHNLVLNLKSNIKPPLYHTWLWTGPVDILASRISIQYLSIPVPDWTPYSVGGLVRASAVFPVPVPDCPDTKEEKDTHWTQNYTAGHGEGYTCMKMDTFCTFTDWDTSTSSTLLTVEWIHPARPQCCPSKGKFICKFRNA